MLHEFIICCLIGFLSMMTMAADSDSGKPDVGDTDTILSATPENDAANADSNPENPHTMSLLGNYRFVDGGDSTVVQYKKNGNYRTIAVNVNGKNTFCFLLGTGRRSSVISKKAADRMQLEPFGDPEMRGSAGNAVTRYVKIDSLQIGDLVWYPMQFEVVEDEEKSECIFSPDLDGVIGYDFIELFPVRISRDWKRVVIFDATKAAPSKPGIPVEIDLKDRQAIIKKASFEGHSIQVVIDLASSAPFVLFYDWSWTKTCYPRIPFNLNKYDCEGIEGYWMAYEMYIDYSLKLGDIEANSYGFIIGHRLVEAQKLNPASALIGIGFCEDYSIFIDYPNSRIYFEKGEKED